MKEFDLEKAKAGAKVCTRDGRGVRIVCFDMDNKYSIVALVRNNDEEQIYSCCSNGRFIDSNTIDKNDLMLAGLKKEGWINVYEGSCCGRNIYPTRDDAIKARSSNMVVCDTIHIEWEE